VKKTSLRKFKKEIPNTKQEEVTKNISQQETIEKTETQTENNGSTSSS
jgi:hypothetical protein